MRGFYLWNFFSFLARKLIPYLKFLITYCLSRLDAHFRAISVVIIDVYLILCSANTLKNIYSRNPSSRPKFSGLGEMLLRGRHVVEIQNKAHLWLQLHELVYINMHAGIERVGSAVRLPARNSQKQIYMYIEEADSFTYARTRARSSEQSSFNVICHVPSLASIGLCPVQI